MISRAVLLRRVLPAAVAVWLFLAALAYTPRPPPSVQLAEPEQEFLALWTSALERRQLEEEHELRPLEGEGAGEARRRALRTVGVPGEGLLLAVANSDEDAIDGFGHDKDADAVDGFIPHKDLFPFNRCERQRQIKR